MSLTRRSVLALAPEKAVAPLQRSCLENPMDGGAWWAAVHGVAKSWTRLSDFTSAFHFHALEKAVAPHSSILAWRSLCILVKTVQERAVERTLPLCLALLALSKRVVWFVDHHSITW